MVGWSYKSRSPFKTIYFQFPEVLAYICPATTIPSEKKSSLEAGSLIYDPPSYSGVAKSPLQFKRPKNMQGENTESNRILRVDNLTVMAFHIWLQIQAAFPTRKQTKIGFYSPRLSSETWLQKDATS